MNWRRFLRRAKRDAELQQEIALYVRDEIAENVERGIQPEEARRQAYLKFGNPQRVQGRGLAARLANRRRKLRAGCAPRNPAANEIANYRADGGDLSRAGNSREPIYLYRRE